MSTMSRRQHTWIRSIRDRMLGAVQFASVTLAALSLCAPVRGQAPPGTATASPISRGSALIQWSFELTGGGAISQIQIRHCSAGAAACAADVSLFQGNVNFTNCDTQFCPTYAYDLQLTASTTYVDMVTLIPAASNTTGQVTSVTTAAYTTPAFPVPSITSFQAMSGSSLLLTTSESSQYYSDINVYGCPGSGCTNFTSLGLFVSGLNPNIVGVGAPSTLTSSVYGLTPSTTYTVYVTATDGTNTSAASPTFTLETPPPDTTPPHDAD
jgi:hypothetical protein